MANEITITTTISVAKGNIAAISRGSAFSVTMTGDRITHLTQNIGTSEEAINLGDVSTPGYFWVKNLDSTNYVEIRGATGIADSQQVNAGEQQLFRFAADAVPYAIANTAAVDIEFLLCSA